MCCRELSSDEKFLIFFYITFVYLTPLEYTLQLSEVPLNRNAIEYQKRF